MRILITGASGFVGANLVRGLAAMEGVTVVAADCREPDETVARFWHSVWPGIQMASVDITDRSSVCSLIAGASITHIIHAAALTPPPDQERSDPTRIVDVNLGGTVHVLDAAVRCSGVKRVLILSSSGIYGGASLAQRGAITEDTPPQLDNLYAVTKYSAELLLARYRDLSGKEMAAVRLGPVFGPLERSSSSRPQLSQPGRLLAALLAGREVTVAGAQVARDWIEAGEVASACVLLLAAAHWRHGVYNLGGGRAISFGEMVDAFVDHGLRATWIADPSAADIAMFPRQARQPMDIARLQMDTGFAPTLALQTGIGQMIAAAGD